MFKKWFGEDSAASDTDVRWILNEATTWMTGRGSLWNALCCDTAAGACGSCQPGTGTQAFVTSWWYTNNVDYKFNTTWVRVCESMMNSDPREIGFIMFHELVHMTSQVVDS